MRERHDPKTKGEGAKEHDTFHGVQLPPASQLLSEGQCIFKRVAPSSNRSKTKERGYLDAWFLRCVCSILDIAGVPATE